ncbi:MAG: DUF1905 domain-containing protein [Candidatus Kerfeldbacteria bacterium]|nr:DUF1905 domain-containing protein [Candidatus Kerfeldbacteria bacterium]
MRLPSFTFTAKLWEYPGKAAWYFLTLDRKQSATIMDLFGDRKRGFGSIRVKAMINDVAWETSIFPSSSDKAYILPVKKSVRQRAGIETGSRVTCALEIKDV